MAILPRLQCPRQTLSRRSWDGGSRPAPTSILLSLSLLILPLAGSLIVLNKLEISLVYPTPLELSVNVVKEFHKQPLSLPLNLFNHYVGGKSFDFACLGCRLLS